MISCGDVTTNPVSVGPSKINIDRTDLVSPSKVLQSNPTEKIILPKISGSPVKPINSSQLMTAIKLIPPKSLASTNLVPVPVITYTNLGMVFKNKKFKDNATKQEIAVGMAIYTPALLAPLTENAYFPLEDPKNWYWTITDDARSGFWLAGQLKLDQKLLPAIKPENYQKAKLQQSHFNAFVAQPGSKMSRYGNVIVPLSSDFSYFLYQGTDLTIADETGLGLLKNGTGLLGEPGANNLFAFCSEPEMMLIFKPEIHLVDFKKFFPEQAKMDDFKNMISVIHGYERHPGLSYVAVCYLPDEEWNLRFVLLYENTDQSNVDTALLSLLWNKREIEKIETWRKQFKLAEVRFGTNLNCGIIECRIDKKLPTPLVMNTIVSRLYSGVIGLFLK